jgi:hypothetical protein
VSLPFEHNAMRLMLVSEDRTFQLCLKMELAAQAATDDSGCVTLRIEELFS